MAAALDLVGLVAGCFLGGVARYTVSGAVARRIGETFPWGTLLVNTSGAFLAGLAAGSGLLASETARLAFGTGFLGCYTTVSSLALQTLLLMRGREYRRAAANLLGSALLGIVACALGLGLGGLLA